MSYAVGIYAKAICDRCGFEYDYLMLQKEWTGFKVCPECYEPKHPQLEPSHQPTDPEALHEPRPDVSESANITIELPVFSDKTARKERLPALIAKVGSVTLGGSVFTPQNHTEALYSLLATGSIGSPTVQGTALNILTVTVANPGAGNRYYISGYSGPAPTITLSEGQTYRFDQSDSSNSGHPLRFSTTSDGTHGGGTQYTTGVTTVGTPGTSGAYTQIVVAVGAPTLYYYCSVHSGMGGQANTP